MTVTSGSLFTGFGGLLLATEDALGTQPLWCSEYEPPSKKTPNPKQAAARILDFRFPGLPNLGDIQTIDWSKVDEVDVVEGGYPCPGESAAGLRLGMDDPRWMWPAYFRLIREMRPKIAIGENVRGHLTRSFRYVLADLQSIGYAVVWTLIKASDVGCCHERMRLILLAYDEQSGPPAGLGQVPVAHLIDGDWQSPTLIGAKRVGGIPAAGAAYAGALYAGALYAGPPSPSSLAKLLPTPITTDVAAPSSADAGRKTPGLRAIEHLLATPRCADGMNHPLRRNVTNPQGRLEDQIALLPSPMAADGERTSLAHRRGNPTLAGAVEAVPLLATPRVSATRTSRSAAMNPESRSSPSLEQCIEIAGGVLPREFQSWLELPASWHPAMVDRLLPTPKASDGDKGGPNQRGSSGDYALPAAVQPERWGKYAGAIARWEALSRPAPEPTSLSARGALRLNPYFVEWMMDAPEGWIVDVPGITRNEALRAGGNGVVRRQGAAAIAFLSARIPASVLRESGRAA